MKVCAKCKLEKELIEFSKSSKRKDGHHPYCKQCTKEWREANKESLSKKKKEYYNRDIDGMRSKLRNRYAENPQKYLEQQRKLYSSHEGRRKKILIKAKESARIRGLDFNLELNDIEIPTHCPYLGVELTHSLGKGQLSTNSSIDRIDSSKGYVKGNVQIISRQANTMKNNATIQQLITFANSIIHIHGNSC